MDEGCRVSFHVVTQLTSVPTEHVGIRGTILNWFKSYHHQINDSASLLLEMKTDVPEGPHLDRCCFLSI